MKLEHMALIGAVGVGAYYFATSQKGKEILGGAGFPQIIPFEVPSLEVIQIPQISQLTERLSEIITLPQIPDIGKAITEGLKLPEIPSISDILPDMPDIAGGISSTISSVITSVPKGISEGITGIIQKYPKTTGVMTGVTIGATIGSIVPVAGTVAGAFLASINTGTSGKLFCAADFSTSRSVDNGDTLNVTYTLSAADDGA